KLYDPNLAQGKLSEHCKKFGSANLQLYYPADDPRARQACDRIKKQVEAVGTVEEGKVTINLEPLPAAELFRRVHDEGNFDLAVATSVKLAFDDGPAAAQAKWLPPTTLFAGVARWRIE